jgi:UDP-N-acetylmuramoyl-tripeptide--D-alanyl-D-alanine ligase
MNSIESIYKLFCESTGISTDTRKINQHNIYFALKGANFNGNNFAEQAINLGASYAIIDEVKFQLSDRYILVENALTCLQELAAYHRSQLNIPVIAICGSNGKTTTKELTGSVLKTTYHTYVTQGNLNNHIGVPLSILSITKQHEIAVLELGANHLLETKFLCEIAKPTHGIITNNGKDHLEGYGSLENVQKANGELYDYIRTAKGKVFVSNMQADLMQMSESLSRIVYGVYPAYYYGNIIPSDYLHLKIYVEQELEVDVQTKLVGEYNFENVLAAFSIGHQFHVPVSSIKEALEGYVPGNNRSQLVYSGNNKIIVDCYNANPSSMELAIRTLAKQQSETILIMGDMYELGEFSKEEHERMLQLAQKLGIHHIWTVGAEFDKANKNVKAAEFTFLSTDEMINWLKEQRIRESTILLKASRAMKLERLLEFIK